MKLSVDVAVCFVGHFTAPYVAHFEGPFLIRRLTASQSTRVKIVNGEELLFSGTAYLKFHLVARILPLLRRIPDGRTLCVNYRGEGNPFEKQTSFECVQ